MLKEKNIKNNSSFNNLLKETTYIKCVNYGNDNIKCVGGEVKV